MPTCFSMFHPNCATGSHPLLNLFGAMSKRARHFGTAPNLAPLDAGYFRSIRGQRAALFNEFSGTVLLTRGSQFLHKIHALARLVADLGQSFRTAAERLGADGSVPTGNGVAWTPCTMT